MPSPEDLGNDVINTNIGLVNIGQYMGYLPGQTGSFVLVPVVEGDVAVRLSQQHSLTLSSEGEPQALMFAEPSEQGIHVTIGAANGPLPQPTGPSEPLDLGTGGIIYAPLREVTPLNITVPTDIEVFEIGIPDEVDLVTVSTSPIWVPTGLSIDFSEPSDPGDPTVGPWLISGDGIPGTVELAKYDNVLDPMTFDGSNYPTTTVNAGFISPGLGLSFPFSDDPLVDRVPPRLAIEFVGKTRKTTGVVCTLIDYAVGFISMNCDYDGFRLSVWGAGGGGDCLLACEIDEDEVHSYKVEWTNDPHGPGGSAELFVDDVSVATASLDHKPAISSGAGMHLNNSAGNFSLSIAGLEYHSIGIYYDEADVEYSYTPFLSTTVSAEEIGTLAVDARSVTEQQPQRTIAYHAIGGPQATLDVVVGEVELPAGRAYKAVLMTYPDGTSAPPVAHPDELVMTKFTTQNVRFEDDYLFQTQPSWSECVPAGNAPVIEGIVYTCDAIRIGNYVQFQFGYHLDAETNPTEPFGDIASIPGLSTYMVPHKWYIYDQENELLARVEQPNGEPLNKSVEHPMWQGPFGVRNSGYTTPSSRWTPSGTIGSAVIWASHDLVDHERTEVESRVPIPEQIVPMACHLDYSVNGFDPRVSFGFAGPDGNMNGFGNWRSMPYERSDYETWTTSAPSGDPYTGLDGLGARGPSGAIWLKYTPFNIQGRSPITGPGGVRDDRQAIAEPVSAYLCEPDGTHIANGASYRQIAIDYCRGYASDPFHLFEEGRNIPLFKGQQRRSLTLNGHYYGPGDLGQPWSNRFALYLGRASQWIAGTNPTKVQSWVGSDEDHPWRGLFGIDDQHAHQFPGWGSLLWKTPEFAFLQIKFFEQVKMYQGGGLLLGSTAYDHLTIMQDRSGAWTFLHTALAWKLGSARSQRLYTRKEIIEWAVTSLETVYDNVFATTPGIFNLPVTDQTSEEFGPGMMSWFQALNLFGMCRIDEGHNLSQQTFMRGYWIHALGCAERMGFNSALRGASDKAASVLDWMIAKWRQAIVGNLTKISTHLPQNSSYFSFLWTPTQMESLWPDGDVAGGRMGDITTVPQTYEELESTNGVLPTWDYDPAEGSLDGQGMSSDLSAPFWLKNVLGLSGEDIDAACSVARTRFDAKLAEQVGLGEDGGSTWFRYHQGTFTPPLPVFAMEPPLGYAWVVDGPDKYVFENSHQIYTPVKE